MYNEELLKEIKSKKSLYNKYGLNIEEKERLKKDFIVSNTYNSNAIEGNTITENETSMILNDNMVIEGKSLNEHLDIVNHAEALEYIFSIVDSKTKITEETIKDIHYLVLNNNKENRGSYRTVNVRVGSHIPPSYYKINDKMNQLIYDYQNNLQMFDSIIAIAMFHADFETIHPFIDGNGRTGRLILNLELMRAGYLPIDIKKSNVKEYYLSFSEFNFTNSYTKIIDLVLNYENKVLDFVLGLTPENK